MRWFAVELGFDVRDQDRPSNDVDDGSGFIEEKEEAKARNA